MAFDLSFVVPPDSDAPDPARIEKYVAKIPLVEKQKDFKDGYWQYEYLNPETGVVCTFTCVKPVPGPAGLRGRRDAGFKVSLPFLCPTFMARETLPFVEALGRTLQLGVVTPAGDCVEDCDAGRLQVLWLEGNRRTLERFGTGQGRMPSFFPRERLDEMWRYMSARHSLETRYKAKGIYVPRVILLQSKLNRRLILLTAMWTELGPAVIPDVDAFVIGQPRKRLFGLLPSGAPVPVVVRAKVVMPLLEPLLRHVDRPIPHRILENAGKARKAILREMGKVLTPPFTNHETVGVEEVVDIQV